MNKKKEQKPVEEGLVLTAREKKDNERIVNHIDKINNIAKGITDDNTATSIILVGTEKGAHISLNGHPEMLMALLSSCIDSSPHLSLVVSAVSKYKNATEQISQIEKPKTEA